VRSVPRPNRF